MTPVDAVARALRILGWGYATLSVLLCLPFTEVAAPVWALLMVGFLFATTGELSFRALTRR